MSNQPFWAARHKTLERFLRKEFMPKALRHAPKATDWGDLARRMFPGKLANRHRMLDWAQQSRTLDPKFPDVKSLFLKPPPKVQAPQLDNIRFPFTRHEELKTAKRFFVTSAMNNTDLDQALWATVKAYCKRTGAMLIVVPSRYKNPTTQFENDADKNKYWWPAEVMPYMTDDLVQLHEHLCVMGHVRVQATAQFPLTGLEDLSKGMSAIFAHAATHMTPVPAPQRALPKVLWTTTSLSEPQYSDTKLGIEARFHHQKGGVVVELDGPRFHARWALFDGKGFYSLDSGQCRYHTPRSCKVGRAEAINPGDVHVKFADRKCTAATFANDDSIVNASRPRYIAWNDVLDMYSGSHHHDKNPVTQIAKYEAGAHLVQKELDECIEYMDAYTPPWATGVVVSSNHHDHLLRWMKEKTPLKDPANARFWIKQWARLVDTIELGPNGATCASPMQLYMEDKLKAKTRFLHRGESFLVAGVDISFHGDEGINGSRGSARQYSRIGVKTNTGHSHSPQVIRGAWQAGTMTGQLEYEGSLTTHAQAHILTFPNGKRTMVFVVAGHWYGKN